MTKIWWNIDMSDDMDCDERDQIIKNGEEKENDDIEVFIMGKIKFEEKLWQY